MRTIALTFSFDSSVKEVEAKGNLSAMSERIGAYGKKKFGGVLLVTQDTKNYSHVFAGVARVTHVPSALLETKFLKQLSYLLLGAWNLIAKRDSYGIVRAFGTACPHAAIARVITGKPLVVSYHYDWSLQTGMRRGAVAGEIAGLLERFVLRSADLVVALTPALEEKAKKIGAKKIVVIPNFVDTNEFRPGLPHADIERKYGLKKKRVVIFVGRLHPVKRVDALIRAHKKVQEKIPNSVLLICGEGAEKEKLKTLSRELNTRGVIFCGRVPRQEVPKYLCAADVFALPSAIEGQPNALVEALACGLPVVGTDVEGTRDTVEDRRTGLLVQVGDTSALAGAIIRLLGNEKLRREMAARCRKTALERYSKKKLLAKENAILAKML
ncbi:MAG: glycosyltransferase [Candidatus Micrarchaeota archaeon]